MRHFSFGVFLPKFKEHFQCGSGEISTIGSIQMGVCFGAGNEDLFRCEGEEAALEVLMSVRPSVRPSLEIKWFP